MNRSQQFEGKLTARHSTSTWQYFVGGEQIAEFDGGGAQPGATVTHQVNVGQPQALFRPSRPRRVPAPSGRGAMLIRHGRHGRKAAWRGCSR